MENKEFPRSGISGSGTETAYSVEARSTYVDAVQDSAGAIYDIRWKRVYFKEAALQTGVPSRFLQHYSKENGLVGWAAANALRWWFHAVNDMGCFETRIVKHEIKYSYQEIIISAHDIVTGENRGSIMPLEKK